MELNVEGFTRPVRRSILSPGGRAAAAARLSAARERCARASQASGARASQASGYNTTSTRSPSTRGQVSPAELHRMATEERLSLAMMASEETATTEQLARRGLQAAEERQLQQALEESRNMALMDPQERIAAEEARLHEQEEPPLRTESDVAFYDRWLLKQAEIHSQNVHPREYDGHGRPSNNPLPLWTSRREIGRQFGAGVELYLGLLDLCLKACLLGGALYGYSLYLNLQHRTGLDVEVGSGEVHVNSSAVFDLLYAQAFWRSLPLQLALTTAGARMQCTDDDCRLANTLTATADCVLSLLLLVYLPRSLRRHQAAVARRVNHARVTVADYSVELLGLRPNVTPEEVVELVRRRLVQHAEARLHRLEHREAKAVHKLEASCRPPPPPTRTLPAPHPHPTHPYPSRPPVPPRPRVRHALLSLSPARLTPHPPSAPRSGSASAGR